MNLRLLGYALAIALLGSAGVSVAQSNGPAAALQQDDHRGMPDRATAVFRILNEAGIAFEKTRAKAFQSIEEGNYAEARKVCSGFLEELGRLRGSTEILVALNKDDLRYVESKLLHMKRRIERILDDMPPMF